MFGALRIETFGDTVIVVFALATAAMIGAAFGFRQAIRGVADYEDDKAAGRFVRWLVESGDTPSRSGAAGASAA
ncbi:MAG: hypothetical protein JWQ20_2676 [Conexibacter sp.]|nr:hypothetical protein [Conexibacter sp.]